MTTLTHRVYELLNTVPAGRVTTYKALGEALGTRAYRAIGQAMRRNPYAYMDCTDVNKRIPCHRVVASDGRIGGFMGKRDGKEIEKKIKLLASEGIEIKNNKVIHFDKILYRLQPQFHQ